MSYNPTDYLVQQLRKDIAEWLSLPSYSREKGRYYRRYTVRSDG